MIKLHAQLADRWDAEPSIVRLRESAASLGASEVTMVRTGEELSLACPNKQTVVRLPRQLGYLSDGDVVRLVPRMGEINVLYRRSSPFNTILLTERCNSRCLMCSQPPKERDDSYLLDLALQTISLMDRNTVELGFTGGEPTLLGSGLIDLLAACEEHLPETAVHLLTNGRLFNYLSLAQRLAAVNHHDLMLGIPIYSDIASEHDFVVQAKGAFDQTLRGVMNLARCGVRIEIRIVLHRQTIDRLEQTCRYIARNLPFVDHVALMGLETIGFVKMNLDALWIDPAEYQSQLRRAVEQLREGGINLSIYNHQLCVLDRSLWGFARKSISDWKNDYYPVCDACGVKNQCGGFFSSSTLRHSDLIRPITDVSASLPVS